MPDFNRRAMLGALGGLAALPAFSSALAKAAKTGRKPNIVFILADDMGWGDPDAYNKHSLVPTPNMDRLASQGMRFTDMHSADAVCTPSRYAILTGRYCWRGRLKDGVLSGYDPSLIEKGRLTVAGMLKQAGYYTAGVGKWHLGLGDQPVTDYAKPLVEGPIDHGFDYYFGIPASLDMPPYLFFENDHAVAPAASMTKGNNDPRGVFWRAGAETAGFKMDEVVPTLTAKAVDVIEQRAKHPDQPFFLYFPLPSPHTPWVPLPEYKGKSGAGDYGDYVVETDAMIGKVVAALEDNGFGEDTIVIVTSDNGADWREEDIDKYGHRANAEWRGRKADVWEAGHRIPFIIRWPGHIRPDSVSSQIASLADFMATVAAILNIPLPDDAAEDSFNMLPALEQATTKPIRPNIIDHSLRGMLTIREGDWKLEVGLGSGGFSDPKSVDPAPNGPKGQLYNLADDPHEQWNLYNQRPDIVKRLTAKLDQIKAQGYSRPMPGHPAA